MHRDRYGRSPAPAASHRPVGKKRMQQASSDRSPKRTEPPELPRLRALEAHAADIPISSSAPSSTSPRSGSSRVNPYPVGEATESSPFEVVPSAATQATHSWEQGGSLEITPIRDETSSITPLNAPTQRAQSSPALFMHEQLLDLNLNFSHNRKPTCSLSLKSLSPKTSKRRQNASS